MGVPETTVYEDYGVIVRKNEVRFARVSFVADSVTESGFVKGRTDLLFRRGVLAADVRHVEMSG